MGNQRRIAGARVLRMLILLEAREIMESGRVRTKCDHEVIKRTKLAHRLPLRLQETIQIQNAKGNEERGNRKKE